MPRPVHAFVWMLPALVLACGGENPTNPGPSTPAATEDVSGIHLSGSSIIAEFVDEELPTGSGAGPTVEVVNQTGSTVELGVTTPTAAEALYLTVDGKRGYFKLSVSSSATLQSSTAQLASTAAEVRYNLAIDLTDSAQDDLTFGVATAVGTFLSLLSGIQICIPGPCTGPSPEAPNIEGLWSLKLFVDGTDVPGVGYDELVITDQTPHPDATASFKMFTNTTPGLFIGNGSIAANGAVHVEYFSNQTGACDAEVVGNYMDGSYVASAADNGGRAMITGNAGPITCVGGQKFLEPPIEGLTHVMRKLL